MSKNKTIVDGEEEKSGDVGTIRTCDRLLRRQMLYPTELRHHGYDAVESVFKLQSLDN